MFGLSAQFKKATLFLYQLLNNPFSGFYHTPISLASSKRNVFIITTEELSSYSCVGSVPEMPSVQVINVPLMLDKHYNAVGNILLHCPCCLCSF